ncbi:MAG: glycine cleavage system aminomethyltransferase GcvT [Cyclobacteriaceae bacterium]
MKSVPLEKTHQALGAKMVPFAGFNMPLKYASEIEEHLCVREKAGLFDVSHMGEFIVEGSDALDWIQYVTCNDVSKLVISQAQYSCLMNDAGGLVDDLLVYKLADEKYMLVVNASNIEKDKAWILQHKNNRKAEFTDISEETILLALQGPKAQAILQEITSVQLEEIPFYHFTVGDVAGIQGVTISATGYTGSGGYELYAPKEYGQVLWDALLKVGEGVVQPVGLGCRDTLRLEKGYSLYGNDINDETSPLEAGLGWVVKLKKGDFLSQAILQKQKEAGLSRKLVGIKVVGKGIPRKDYAVTKDGNKVGVVTSGSFSPSLKEGIALAYIETEFSKIGTELTLVQGRREIAVEVVKTPFV